MPEQRFTPVETSDATEEVRGVIERIAREGAQRVLQAALEAEVGEHLQDQLKRLKMPGLWQALDLRLSEAQTNNLGHLEFLSL